MSSLFLFRRLPLLRAAVFAALLAGIWGSQVRAEGPGPVRPAAPSPAPAFPANFAAFSPPTTSTAPAVGAPAIAEWNRTAGPGDSLTVTGSRFSANEMDGGFVVYGAAGRRVVEARATILKLTGDHAAITLPANLPKRSPYLLWPRNAAGLGQPIVLNATEAWWIGPDTLTRGESFAVHGRNLTPTATERASWLFLQTAGGDGRWISTRKANPYRAEYTVPSDLANGTYRVWAHNGLGRELGWSGPFTLTVDDGLVWDGPTFDVRAYGAKGNGVTDDYVPIATALTDAQAAPGATVYFPPGTYAVGTTLNNLPPRVRLRGAGMDRTRVQPTADFAATNSALVYGPLEKVEIREMTFDTAGVLDGTIGNTVLYLRGSSRAVLDRVRVTQERDVPQSFTDDKDAIVDLHLCDHVTLRGCDFRVSGGMFLGSSRQILVQNCRFRGLNDLGAFIYLWGGDGVSVTGCTAADFDNRNPLIGRGWAQGRFLAGVGTWGATRNVYFGSNVTSNLTVRPRPPGDTTLEQNTGEQFLFEGMETLIRGKPDAVGTDSVTFNGFTGDYVNGQTLVVIAGPGSGQARFVKAFNATLGQLTLDRPWTVAPDPTSTIAVGHYMARMTVYGNALSGKPRAVESSEHVACAGVQPFGGCVDFVVAGNTFKRLRYGVSTWSNTNKFGTNQVLQPNFFNEFLRNRFVGCRFGVRTWLKHLEPGLPTLPDTGMLGNLYRGNTFTGLREPAFTYELDTNPPGVAMTILDGNRGDRAPFFLNDNNGGFSDQVLIRNRFPGASSQLTIAP